VKNAVLSIIIACSSETFRCFGSTYILHLQG
jgi:hypothetical protein